MKSQTKNIIQLIIFLVLFFLFYVLLFSAVDTSDRSNAEMLCRSAKKSLNLDYIEKCECYYQGQDVSCINQYVKR